MRGAFLHVLGDLFGSVAAIVAGVLIVWALGRVAKAIGIVVQFIGKWGAR